MDILAWLIIGLFWIFGGAAFFHNSYRTKYKDVVIGWTLLNGIIVVACIGSMVIWWAFMRVFA